MSDEEKPVTVVRIAGMDIPVHLAWHKIETLNTGADILEQLNAKYPHLASDFTHEIIPLVRDRMKSCIGDLKPPPKVEDKEAFTAYLKEKIQHETPADLVDISKNEKGIEISIEDLIYFVGEDEYLGAIQREAEQFVANKISYKQMCEIWNGMQLPAPGKAHWTVGDITEMLGEEEQVFASDS